MSSAADSDPQNDPESWSSTVLLVGRFLTVLRLVTIGCLVAILAALAQEHIIIAPPWEDELVGGVLLAYALAALVLVGILQVVREHPIWVVELGLILDGVVLTFIALNTTDVLALFLLLPIMAVGILRGLATALVGMAAVLFIFLLHIFLMPDAFRQLQAFSPGPCRCRC